MSAGFGGFAAIAAHLPDGTEVRRWPCTKRLEALLWLGNRPPSKRITLEYVPAVTAHERSEDLGSRHIWRTPPRIAYGGLRLWDI